MGALTSWGSRIQDSNEETAESAYRAQYLLGSGFRVGSGVVQGLRLGAMGF